MKTFYTERDVSDLAAAGTTEIEIDDGVVLTDLAREKAIALGIKLKVVSQRSSVPDARPRLAVAPQMQLPPAVVGPSSPLPPPVAPASSSDLAAQVKAAVIARLGTTAHNSLLDQVIPQVLARLGQ